MPGPPTAPAHPEAASPRLFLFGPMRGEFGADVVEIPAGNAQRLLAYLVLHPRAAHRREALIDVLWPDATADAGRRALSDTIYRLRARHRDLVRSDPQTVGLVDRLWTDVWAFDRLAGADDGADLAAAVELYRDDLVPAIYDDWIGGHRVARRRAYLTALTHLVDEREQRGELLSAVQLARQMILAEPLDEAGHQAYLRLLGRLRRVGEAVAHFDELTRTLRDELGVEPDATTAAIVETIVQERDVGATVQRESPTPFVGRRAERARVLDAVDAALTGRGAVIGIEGPAGIGKSRLLDEVLAGARWRGAAAVSAGVSGVPEPSALAPLANALAPVLRGPLLVHLESTLDESTLGVLSDLHPEWAARRAGSPWLMEHAETRLGHALRALGAAMASAGRIVLALDDMHRATPTLWQSVAAFADGFVPGGGLLLLAYRRPGIEQTDGWAVLHDLDRDGVAAFVGLGPFELDEIAELMPDEADPAGVLAATGGIPFYVAAWSGRMATRGEGPDLEAMVRERLESLTPSWRAALECAAVIGDDVPYRVWVDVTQAAPMALAVAAENLTKERWLTPSEAGYAFAHDMVRGAVYAGLDDRRRAALHRLVADALAGREPSNARARAFHLDRAGLAAEAAEMYVEAGRQARQALIVRDAVDLLDRALTLLPAGSERRLDVAIELAEACEVIGDRERQQPLFGWVVDGARARGDDPTLLRVLVLAGGSAGRTDDPSGGDRLLAEASEVAARLGDPRSVALVAYRQADLHGQQGRWVEALRSIEQALEQARRADDPALLGGVLRMRGIIGRFTGDPAGGLRWLEEAVEVHRAAGDPLEALNSAANLTGTYYEIGAWDELLAVAGELLPTAIAFGDPSIIGILLHQSGLAAMSLGDPVVARQQMIEARQSFVRARRRRLIGLVTNTIGLVAEDEGDLDEAMTRYREAMAIAEEVGAETELAFAGHDLGALLVRSGRPDEAIPLLERASATWERNDNVVALAKTRAHLAMALLDLGSTEEASRLADLGLATLRQGFPPGEQAQGWLWTLSNVLGRLERRHEARAVLVAAGAELDRQADAIADPERRQQFLERVPLNRAIGDALRALDGQQPATTTVRVSLARADAPLGRPLRADERVDVEWTIEAPDDAAIDDDRARRHQRLVRLLAQATAAGAAPTDDDLARALGVSRRTILRDLAALGPQRAPAATRRRLRSNQRR